MSERPILFSAPMVRALLAGTKTQTRRIVRDYSPGAGGASPAWRLLHDERWYPIVEDGTPYSTVRGGGARCPYGAPGDWLWVRETVEHVGVDERGYDRAVFAADRAPTPLDTWPWKRRVLPAIHMPRGLRRIELEVTGVRVERLHAITEDDARAEGVAPAPFCKAGRPDGMEHVEAFENLWREINGAESWDANPWVWVVSFKRVRP